MEDNLSQILHLLCRIDPSWPEGQIESMRHGIDLKTHSQCQRQRPTAAYRPEAGSRIFILETFHTPGGASRDRTDDLKLAKLALSQLSYGPLRQVADGNGGPRRT